MLFSVSSAEEFVPSMEVGDNWTVRREITAIDDLESNSSKIQYWKYEVINKIEFNKEEYLVIFASSKDVNGNIKIIVNKDKFILKEITCTDKNKVTLVNMEEVIAPVMDKNIFARLYDLPAFPLKDPNTEKENVDILPNGKKRIRKSFRRHYFSRGDTAISELIWQETDNIFKNDILTYSHKSEDYINKIKKDGYILQIYGETKTVDDITKRIKQIWVESAPWWIYNESAYEKDYMVDYHSGAVK